MTSDARSAPRANDPAQVHERDERLAELLGRLADDLRAGRSADVEGLARQHVDLADELRWLWTAMLMADCAAASQISGAENATSGPGGPDVAPTGDFKPLEPFLADLAAAEELTPTSLGPAGAQLPRRFGDYALLAEIGRGGMGIVFKAWQFSLERVVALKMILRGDLATPADLARFRTEAQAAARLDHPHVVPVYEVGEHHGRPYFTMKFIEGTTLARRLAEGPLVPREAAELLAPVCEAIHYAHGHGLLHRDLKPSNVLIDVQGRPHITDFGLAKRVEGDQQLTISGAVLGTPAYMAPEQAAGTRGKLGPTSDVYGLGAILYHMLTGRPPFQAASAVDTVLLVLEQDPLPPRLLNPKADRDLEMVALRCLQKPPDLRYATARLLADDLRAYLADEPVSARSGVFGQVVARWFRETHQATTLEHWGLLWMWHSLALLGICLATNILQWWGQTSAWPYFGLWIAGLGTWAIIFWALRRRSGPVTFVERQIAHVWAANVISIALLFVVELLLGLPVLTLSPIIALAGGTGFLVKAGMLTGKFYAQATALFATAVAMAWLQSVDIPVGITLFGIVSAVCFFVPGLKYYRQQRQHD